MTEIQATTNAMPPWMDGSFIRTVIQLVEDTDKDIEPVSINCKYALPPGNNYLSDVFRVAIDYKVSDSTDLKTASLFVKIPFTSGPTAEFMRVNKLYEKEVKVYNEILPKMYSLGFTMLSPVSYPATPMENSLVLEDLSQTGYMMLNRVDRMDFQHCCSFLRAIAKFHAMSVALHKKEPDLVESLGTHMLFNLEHVKGRNKINITLNYFAATLSEIGCERYAQMVRERIDTYWDKTAGVLKPGNKLNVLCHGDCWTPNIMFKHESGQIVGTKLVDFQQSIYTSFGFDVMLFWWTSANEDVREQHKEELFEVYRTALNESLVQLKCSEILTKTYFESEMKRLSPFTIFLIGCFSAITFADPDDFMDTELSIDFNSPDQGLIDFRYFHSKYYKSALPKLIEQGERFGMFD